MYAPNGDKSRARSNPVWLHSRDFDAALAASLPASACANAREPAKAIVAISARDERRVDEPGVGADRIFIAVVASMLK